MEHYSKEGMINRATAADITRGKLVVLNEDSQFELATADAAGAVFVAEWDVKAGDVLAAHIIGASAGTAIVVCEAGELVPGVAVYLAADGKVSLAGTRAIGFYLGEKKTTTEEEMVEVALA